MSDKMGGNDEALRRIEEARRTGATQLDLSDLGLTELPDALKWLSRLEELNLAYNRLIEIPAYVGDLRKLTKLSACGNRLCKIPESLGECYDLKFLDIHGNQIVSLPEQIGHLSHIHELNVSNNNLVCLPDNLCNLHSIQKLDLTMNEISYIEAIRPLTQLEELYLLSNNLRALPAWIRELDKLHILSTADNEIEVLPYSIGELRQLRRLYLDRNKLTSMPTEICELSELQELYLSGNRLTEIPHSVGRLQRLRTLYLNDNLLSTLPTSMGQLSNLRVLNIAENQIHYLPEEMKNLHSLREISIYTNPCLENAEIASAPPHVQIQYILENQSSAKPLMEAKLILVGRGGVGKTSLVNRLLRDTFNPNEPITEGIAITPWSIQLRGREDARLHVWDFGGQDILHATHQFFLTHRTLYLLVLSGREGSEDRDARYWLNLLASLAPDSPVIIVLNKYQEYPFDVNRRGLQEKFRNIRQFVVTDCNDSTGIATLRQSILVETDRLDHLRDRFPTSWFRIKDRLAGMRENYLSYTQYQRICRELGEYIPEAQDTLASVLHALGIALNYKDDPRLRDLHVLNPRWVTEGIYGILNAPVLAERFGELNLDDLATILDATKYPRHRHSFLIDLMRKFELCIRFPDGGMHRYLVPELLSKQESQEAGKFRIGESLAFEYHYKVLPEGLLPRFITRTYVHSQGQPRWRTGVILQLERNRGLIKADSLDNRVQILVRGPSADGRKQLLAVIRSHFEEIHRSYSFDEPLAMVPVPKYSGMIIGYDKLLAYDREREQKFKEFFNGELVELNVSKLLNGVDLEEERKPSSLQALRLFYSYSHKDGELRDELATQLTLLRRRRFIHEWHDREILAGDRWEAEIIDNLKRADIILLLVSPEFIASDYCYAKEMEEALRRHESGEARVIPIIVRDVSWHEAPFGHLQALPDDGRAVRQWPDRDTAWRNVADGIERVIKQMSESRSRAR